MEISEQPSDEKEEAVRRKAAGVNELNDGLPAFAVHDQTLCEDAEFQEIVVSIGERDRQLLDRLAR